jgi:hypothetical protein
MNIRWIVLLIIGLSLVVFSAKIAKLMFRPPPESKFNTRFIRYVFFVVPICGIGLMFLLLAFLERKGAAMHSSLKSARGVILLYERGVITRAKVKQASYQIWAPAGWEVTYAFDTNDPQTGQRTKYTGSSQGPEKYCRSATGSSVSVIYDPCYPSVNCEIRCFLNDPSFRHYLKKKDKLYLLDRFREEYELESYTFKEWYSQQQGVPRR